MDTLISNVTVVTMNEKMDVLFGAYLGITDGKISYLEKTPPEEAPGTIIDGTGMVAIPGLINCHTHLAATLFRGMTDDETRADALTATLYKEDKLDAPSARAGALLGIAECLRFGITSVSDLYYYPEATAQAVAESGIKANLALSAYRYEAETEEFDFEADPQCRELCRLADTWHNYDNGRIRIDGGIHAPYTSNYLLWEGIADYCQEKSLGFQLHLAETPQEAEDCLDRTGLGPGELLSCHRVLNVPVTAAGCVGLSPEEKKLLGKHKVSAVTTPLAYEKAGQAPLNVRQAVQAGLNVALGTGSAGECGNLDLFEVMRGTAMVQRRESGDPSALPAPALLMMATVCGARAQGRAEECGMLKLGMDADLALVDFSAPHLIPCHNVLSCLVFSAKGGDVAMTMVRGKILYRNGQFPTIDLSDVVSQITGYAMDRLFKEKE